MSLHDSPCPHIPSGKSYVLTNQKSLVQCMESLTQKLQPGVVISFKKIGTKASPPNGTQESMEVDTEAAAQGGVHVYYTLLSVRLVKAHEESCF